MKTAVTIPWGAVVQGCPPSQTSKGLALPLVVAEHFRQRSSGADEERFLERLSRLDCDALVMISRSAYSTSLEVVMPELGDAIVTSDGSSRAILRQATYPLMSTSAAAPLRHRGAFARTYVLRYARFDPDEPGFFIDDTDDTAGANPDDCERDLPRFLRPQAWGFEFCNDAWRWKARTLFSSSAQPPAPTRLPDPAIRPRFIDPFAPPDIDRGDPSHCRPHLRDVRAFAARTADPVISNISPHLRCGALALAIGRCRQFAVRLAPQDDFTLTPAGFHEACSSLLIRLRSGMLGLTHTAQTARVSKPTRIRGHALEMLETRTDAHAMYLSLDEAYAAALHDGSHEVPAMSRRLHQIRRMINLFDKNLQKNLPLLRLAASTYLLDNWRRLLAPAYRDCPPWWLDGCIG